ncbi:MAG: glycolate oxidase subunit GlcE [Hyphomicrobiales bacterium]
MDQVLRPRDEAELVAAIEGAIGAGVPLEVVGSGTKHALGRPMQTGATLDLSAFTGISLYESDELVITAGAATPLSDIQEAVASRNQMLAFEPPDFSRLLGSRHAGTIGGVLAAALSGPRRLKAGAVRDHVLGTSCVSGRGEAFKAGGRVVKNVTGYDLPKLMAGSFGTLAALTSVTFKVMPRPESEETLSFAGLDDAAAIRLMSAAMQSSAEVSAAAHLPADVAPSFGLSTAATLLRLEGLKPSIDHRRDILVKLLKDRGAPDVLDAPLSREMWAGIRDVQPFAQSRRAVWRISVPPTDGAATLERIRRRGVDVSGYYDWAGGLIWADVPATDDACEMAIRSAFGSGHATLIRAPEHVRSHAGVFQPQERALSELTKRVKAAFDPEGVLNLGRMYRGV